MSRRRSSQSGCYQGAGDACAGHFFDFVLVLVLLEESLLGSIKMYRDMIAIQFDDIYRTLMRIYVFFVIVRQESF